eukprot:CAMPEP_0115276542 /NCGR_PEP_ID=MMETSP0270-20121206/56771_1 /TAXON_ID=71861 /ORGANISM="Scrippsiella trochoidea, Strain CCMP3099" /LENGTH=134 /DNA_ID=CAMNT_0002693141 /DNA_START=3 /DNA_END=404 /DNA_ORIENTATION=-
MEKETKEQEHGEGDSQRESDTSRGVVPAEENAKVSQGHVALQREKDEEEEEKDQQSEEKEDQEKEKRVRGKSMEEEVGGKKEKKEDEAPEGRRDGGEKADEGQPAPCSPPTCTAWGTPPWETRHFDGGAAGFGW